MHKHKANANKTTTTAWTRCVAGGDCNGAAHDGVVHREVCACGAVRYVESNGTHQERSDWDFEDGPAATVRGGEENPYA